MFRLLPGIFDIVPLQRPARRRRYKRKAPAKDRGAVFYKGSVPAHNPLVKSQISTGARLPWTPD
jgi:hypothetical protein